MTATPPTTTNAVVGTVATTDTVLDGVVADTSTVKKRNFHTGLDPVSRTNNSAQPSEFNTAVTDTDKERCAQLSSLDTGSSPVWSVVVGADATDNDRAIVTVTNPDDATVVTGGNHLKSSFPRKRESRTNNRRSRPNLTPSPTANAGDGDSRR